MMHIDASAAVNATATIVEDSKVAARAIFITSIRSGGFFASLVSYNTIIIHQLDKHRAPLINVGVLPGWISPSRRRQSPTPTPPQ
jgi:hypothetical protein